MIKFLDLVKQYHSIKDEIDFAIQEILEQGSFIGGESVKKFEIEFSSYVDANFCVGVGNGTDAIEIALEALNLPSGSEVIVPGNSFIASSEAVTRCGLRVVFVDVNPGNYTICLDSVSKKLTANTSAVIAVHLYGHPCDMDGLANILDGRDIRVIEDCAQAHGAEYKGKRVGSIGDIGTFSFYPGKNLGAYGDGGAITTNSGALAKKARMIANHGRLSKYDHEFEGRNSRLDGLQAAILRVKLKYIEEWTCKRISLAERYITGLSDVAGLILPCRQEWARQVYHLFVMRAERRDELMSYLKSFDIEVGVHYPISLPRLNAYAYLNSANEELFCNSNCDQLISLPIGEHLSNQDVDFVIEHVTKFYGAIKI